MSRVEIWRGPEGRSEPDDGTNNPFTAEGFLNFLRRSNPVWDPTFGGMEEQHWVYRGHQNEAWPLAPSAVRKSNNPLQPLIERRRSQLNADPGWSQKANKIYRDINANILAYHDAMTAFIQLGNEIGEMDEIVPKFEFERGFPEAPAYSSPTTSESFTINTTLVSGRASWPIYNNLLSNSRIVALAQHHGVPTFLLDWTRTPWVAAFFASIGSHKTQDDNDICVWAFNAAEANKINSKISHRCAGNILINEPPKVGNVYLAKQDGLFTYLSEDRSTWAKTGQYPSMEEIIASWTEIEMRKAPPPRRQGFDYDQMLAEFEQMIEEDFKDAKPILRKVILRRQYLPELRLLLRREGITRAHLMPTLDNIAKTVLELAEHN